MKSSPTQLIDYSTYIFDLDGCIHFGNTVAEGAPELIHFLRKRKKRVLFLSNNSTHSPESINLMLNGMGITAAPEDIYLASSITARFIMEAHGESTLCVAGTDDLIETLRAQGHSIVPPESDTETDIFVLGRDLTFSFSRLKACANRILRGATFYACNCDNTHPSLDGGKEPETGAIAAAITAMTGNSPRTFGKPERYAYECIMEDFALEPDECLMIGDNPSTDIQGAHAAGIDACWLMLAAQPEILPDGTTHTYRTITDVYIAMQKQASE
ncbi:HAD-IIA family hydrolase [Halodesulfovibrio spirochaetisodalis]|uniref:HAD family hydrolase n=1 Tax=Halodesulfovibrio spirochaetisodalis TaxID=1560234 RepID=A0A1B7XE15_9BACT|nr:HAD-IIA family hydrolase [Halodesulfovibrio spirochaetisodalis]OBQ52377.1 hypothetical protein SP90_07290 [Halodesulfovibrio spirochaetisodalis]